MRDASRIDPLLHLLGEVWKQNPDLRLGQLIVAAVQPKTPVPEIFYIEDEEIATGLERLSRPFIR